jgi:AraC-like DNA-binding protein
MINTCQPQRGNKNEAASADVGANRYAGGEAGPSMPAANAPASIEAAAGGVCMIAFRDKFTIVKSESGVSVLIDDQFYAHEIGRRFPLEMAGTERLRELDGRSRRAGPPAQLAFRQLQRSIEAGITSEMYYEGKVLELLFLVGASPAALRAPKLPRDDDKAVRAVRSIIDAQYGNCPNIAGLAVMANTSASKLQKDFKTALGKTIHEYLWETRLANALEMLERSGETIGAISLAVGCLKPGRFSKLFKAAYGLTPYEYRKAHVKR